MGYFNEVFLKRNKYNTDIIPRRCGYTFREPGESFECDLRYYYYVIHCTVSGKGYFVHNGKTFESCAGDIFIFPKYDPVGYYSDEKEHWEYYWIAFDGKEAMRLDEVPECVGKTEKTELFREIYKRACSDTLSSDYATSKIYELFDEILESIDTVANPYVEQFVDCVNNNITDRIRVEDMAAKVGITADYLTRLVRGEFGVTPKTYIIQQKLTFAERELMRGKSVAEVAEKYAFCDQFQFSKIFKKYKGSSPTEYLKSNVVK